MRGAAREQIRADLAVIGGGSGGLSVAAGAAQLGLKVVLFEAGEMGGDCLNSGCVPSKAILAAAHAAQAMRDAGRFGLAPAAPQIDWAAVKAHVRGVIDTIAPIDSQERFEGLGVRVVREFARFESPRVVGSESVSVSARRIVLAAGGRAAIPPIPGLAEAPYLTNETIFSAPDFPRHLLVLGAGPIGIELGQAFRRLGAEVTLIDAATALAREDAEAAEVVKDALRAEGVALIERAKVTAASHEAGCIRLAAEVDGVARMIEGSHLLVAVGRKPAFAGLNLEAAGIECDGKGVKTRPNLRTSNPRVWAVGDIAGREQLTHAAGWHASAFVRSALFKATTRADATPMPRAVYCDPELAQVGLTEAEARDRHGDTVKTVRWDFHENDRAQAERDARGFVKLVIGKGGRLLGATCVGQNAGDLIQSVTLAMSAGLKVRALTGFLAAYPTRGEAVKRAAGAYFTPVLFSPRTKALVGLLQRLP